MTRRKVGFMSVPTKSTNVHNCCSERTFVSITLTIVLSSFTWPYNKFGVLEHTAKQQLTLHTHTHTHSRTHTPTSSCTEILPFFSSEVWLWLLRNRAKPTLSCGLNSNYTNLPDICCHLLQRGVTQITLCALSRLKQIPVLTVQCIFLCVICYRLFEKG
jgi:hypothetical protein